MTNSVDFNLNDTNFRNSTPNRLLVSYFQLHSFPSAVCRGKLESFVFQIESAIRFV